MWVGGRCISERQKSVNKQHGAVSEEIMRVWVCGWGGGGGEGASQRDRSL